MLKILISNLRASNRLCSVLHVASNGISLASRSQLLQLTQCSQRCFTVKYSTAKTKSTASDSRKSVSGHNERLTPDEVHLLKQDPDNFGTLSSNKSLRSEANPIDGETPNAVEVPETASEVDVSKKKNATKRTSMKQYEQQLKEMIDRGDLIQAVEFFESKMLVADHVHAPVRIYEWLITECLNSHAVQAAFQIYDLMVNRGLKMSIEIVEKLILAFELADFNIRKLYSLEKIISKYSYEINEKMYNSLVRIYGRLNKSKIALAKADEMKERGVKFEIETINMVFELCVHDKENGFHRLIELWHEIRACELAPNVHTFNALLKVVQKCELTDVDKLKQTIESLIEKRKDHSNGIDDGRPNLLADPPNIGYLFPLENVSKPEDRLPILGGLTGILKLFKHYNIVPITDTVITLMDIVPNTTEAHVRVLSLLKRNNVAPDANLFHVFLTKYCIKPRYNDAKEIIDMMFESNVEVDLVSYGLLSLSCTNKAEAECFFNEMIEQNIRLDSDIVNAMLKNACASNDNDFIICILRQMQTAQIEPTEENFQMVKDYNQNLFRTLRTDRFVSQKTRNSCFKFSREYKQWMKHFRKDQPKVPNQEKIELKSKT